MAKARKGLGRGHNAKDNPKHQSGKGHDIIAKVSPEQEGKDGSEKREEDVLVLRHEATVAGARCVHHAALPYSIISFVRDRHDTLSQFIDLGQCHGIGYPKVVSCGISLVRKNAFEQLIGVGNERGTAS